jgi:hypothetical protein
MVRRPRRASAAQLLHADRRHHVSRVLRCRDVERKHKNERGLSIPKHRGAEKRQEEQCCSGKEKQYLYIKNGVEDWICCYI